MVGANKTEGYTYKDLNGEGWRFKYNANLNYPLSNLEDLGKEMKMFSSTLSSPQLVIIGKDSKVAFNAFGYYPEEDIRAMIESAIKEFDDVHLIDKIGNIFLEDAKISIDLAGHFKSLSGRVLNYEIIHITDDSVVGARIEGSILTLAKAKSTGISSVAVKASNPESIFSEDEFQVMTYPAAAQIIDFEQGENSGIYFYYDGNAVWEEDNTNSFHGESSFRSGYIETPGVADQVTYTLTRTEFETFRDDTVSFAYRISSEYNSDGLEFCIDDFVVEFPDNKWSGEIDWTFAQYPVKAGKHVIDWDYFKWEFGAGGLDAAWIDLVRIPGVISSVNGGNIIAEKDICYNYPNPFNGSTVINFVLNDVSEAKLNIYNIKGESVAFKTLTGLKNGSNSLRLDFEYADSGIYFYNIVTDKKLLTGKFLYLK